MSMATEARTMQALFDKICVLLTGNKKRKYITTQNKYIMYTNIIFVNLCVTE